MTTASHPHVHLHGEPAHAPSHEHDHVHLHAPTPRRAEPGLSLLRMSAMQRLAGAAVVLALLWASVLWALT